MPKKAMMTTMLCRLVKVPDIFLGISQADTPTMIFHTAIRHMSTLERLIEQQVSMTIQIERRIACIACNHRVYCMME